MVARSPMPEPAALYRLLAWLSPSFPVGAFSYSHGVEAAVEAGRVRDAATLAGWIGAIVRHGAGRIDADLFREAHRAAAADDVAALVDAAVRADIHRGTAETALESRAQGAAFLATCRAAWPDRFLDEWAAALAASERPPAYAVAVAAAAARAGVALPAALTAFLHAVAANLVSAGVRLIPLGQTDGQRVLRALEPAVHDSVAACLARDPCDFGGCAFAVDLSSIEHETQYTRLFRS
jgi:urease accessory protein